MQAAWKDHHHARDQTWKTLQMEAVLAAGLVTVDAKFGIPLATIVTALLVIIASLAGVMITLRHRELEQRKFIHIMNCEEELGLHRIDILPLKREAIEELGIEEDHYEKRNVRVPNDDVIKTSAVGILDKINFVDVFFFWKANTSLFILRMHLAIALFSLVLMIVRIYTGAKV